MQDVEIILVLDKSSSMSHIRDKTIESLNTFLDEQKKQPGKCYFTLRQFSHTQEVTYNSKRIDNIQSFDRDNYQPNGMTALYDAICHAIKAAEESVEEGAQVMLAILTDGEENSSTNYTMHDVNRMIDEKTKEGWDFIFLAANQDAMATGQSLGISAGKSMSFGHNDVGIGNTISSVSAYYAGVRSGQTNVADANFSDEDRASALGDD